MPTEPWAPEMVERLTAHVKGGLSARQIAAELGVTRNAVIGQVRRKGLSDQWVGLAERKQGGRKPGAQRLPTKKPAPSWISATRPPPLLSAPEPEPAIDNLIPAGQRRTILELTEETCRWPIGDPGSADFFFCGGLTAKGSPYCAYHHRIAYEPPKSRHRYAPPRCAA